MLPETAREARSGGRLEARVARAVAVVATVWFALAAAWELFGPLLAGHYASSASVGIIAENMLRWHIAGPVWEYVATRPPPEAYYCHHPWGIFWTTALLMEVFGRHDFVCRLAPVLLSIATPPLLFDLGRRIWRPAAGAAAAAAFVVLPIALAFADFNALEVPVIAWSLVFLWGYVRFTQTGRRRDLALTLVGLFFALEADWPSLVLAAVMLAFTFTRSLVLRPFFGPLGPRGGGVPEVVRERRFAAFWLGSAAITVGTIALYLALFSRSHKLGDLFGSAELRAGGNQAPLSKVLASRRYWIELCFTPIAIALGKIAAVVSAIRLLVLRREHEVLPLAVLAMAVVQYVAFKQGADIHVFWPHHFAAYFALSMGALVATIGGFFDRLARIAFLGAARRLFAEGGTIALGAMLVPVAFIARDGIPALRYARETGGRFNEKGLFIASDGAKTAFLSWLVKDMPKKASIEMHDGMKTTWAQVWTLARPVAQNRPAPTTPGKRGEVYLADMRFMGDDAEAAVAENFHVVAVGPFWEVLRGVPRAPIDAYAIDEREPSALGWYFVSGTEPERSIRADPWATWELRTHFHQPADPPRAPPTTLDQRRIAHNIAVLEGDDARAAELLADIRGELRPLGARYEGGSEIIGSTFREGARNLLTIFLLAGDPPHDDVTLSVRSKVVAKAGWSTTMADPTEREVGPPLAISPRRWRRGFLYADPVPIRKRPGHEVFRASFMAKGRGTIPTRLDANDDLKVLDLE